MMNTKTKKGFKVLMTLAGLFSIYAALFLSGNQVKYDTAKTWHIKTAKKKKEDTLKFRAIILNAASEHNVPPALIAAIMHAESNFNPRAVSPVGARGLMQINSVTQRHLGVRNVFNPKENVHGGAKYLNELLSTFRGNTRLAIAAYNAGPGAVKKFRGIPPYKETRKYVSKVMKLYMTYKRQLPKNIITESSSA